MQHRLRRAGQPELGTRGLAEDHQPRGFVARNDRAVDAGHEVLEIAASGGGVRAGQLDTEILQQERHTCKRASAQSGQLLPGRLVVTHRHRIDRALDGFEPCDGSREQFCGCNLAGLHEAGNPKAVVVVEDVVEWRHLRRCGSERRRARASRRPPLPKSKALRVGRSLRLLVNGTGHFSAPVARHAMAAAYLEVALAGRFTTGPWRFTGASRGGHPRRACGGMRIA